MNFLLNRLLGRSGLLVVLFFLAACSEQHDHEAHNENRENSSLEQITSTLPAQNGTQGEIAIEKAWVRPTVDKQDATGVYLTVFSKKAVTLVEVTAPLAERAELHEMKMEGDVMRMRMLSRLELKPEQALEFKPGGYHIMLMGLNAPIQAGQKIDLNLKFEKPDGTHVKVPVKAVATQHAALL